MSALEEQDCRLSGGHGRVADTDEFCSASEGSLRRWISRSRQAGNAAPRRTRTMGW
jgi:hypothetical protein